MGPIDEKNIPDKPVGQVVLPKVQAEILQRISSLQKNKAVLHTLFKLPPDDGFTAVAYYLAAWFTQDPHATDVIQYLLDLLVPVYAGLLNQQKREEGKLYFVVPEEVTSMDNDILKGAIFVPGKGTIQ